MLHALFAAFILLLTFNPQARAVDAGDSRVALVIGNASYRDSPLKNPVNDARAMAAKLRELGFQVVERHNLNTKQIGRTLSEFRSKLTPGGTALFFYAGHGLQVDGANYLPAVDADIGAEEDVPNQSINVDQVLRVMDGGKSRVNLVFLDACRNNPYARSFRSAGEGLAKVNAPSGTLIFYATRPGSVAADGSGRNGLYTENLLAALDVPGLTAEQVQKRVAAGVEKDSNGRQEPWMEGLLKGDFYFKQGSGEPAPDERALKPVTDAPVAKRKPAPVVPVAPDNSEEETYWSTVTQAGDATSYQSYLKDYPNGLHVADANEWLEQDRQAQVARTRLKEDKAWKQAQAANTWQGYGAYLKAYPEGRYAKLARLKQTQMRPASQAFEPEMVAIPGQDYEMGKTHVTVEQFAAFVNDAGYDAGNSCWTFESSGVGERSGRNWRNPGFSQGDQHPVVCINWNDAQAYLEWLSRKTGKTYRLPAENEWKTACDGGKDHQYCGGDDLGRLGWYSGNSGNKTHPVGQKRANGYGLYDMSGNAWQWMQECWEGDCSKRVLRGGSWDDDSAFTRAASRGGDSSSARLNGNGFRVARSARTN